MADTLHTLVSVNDLGHQHFICEEKWFSLSVVACLAIYLHCMYIMQQINTSSDSKSVEIFERAVSRWKSLWVTVNIICRLNIICKSCVFMGYCEQTTFKYMTTFTISLSARCWIFQVEMLPLCSNQAVIIKQYSTVHP